MKFCTRVRLKPSNDRGEFELDRTRSKNEIAENLFALGHETHNMYLQHYNVKAKGMGTLQNNVAYQYFPFYC